MALAYGKKCMGADGRRQLGAQPGGLSLGFARSSASGSGGCSVISTLLPFISVNSFVETYFISAKFYLTLHPQYAADHV